MGRSSDLFTTYPMIKFGFDQPTSYLRLQKHMGKTLEKHWKNMGKNMGKTTEKLWFNTSPYHASFVWDLLDGTFPGGSPGGLLLGLALDVTFHGASRWSETTIVDLGKPPWIGTIKIGRLTNGGMGFIDVKLCKANL